MPACCNEGPVKTTDVVFSFENRNSYNILVVIKAGICNYYNIATNTLFKTTRATPNCCSFFVPGGKNTTFDIRLQDYRACACRLRPRAQAADAGRVHKMQTPAPWLTKILLDGPAPYVLYCPWMTRKVVKMLRRVVKKLWGGDASPP